MRVSGRVLHVYTNGDQHFIISVSRSVPPSSPVSLSHSAFFKNAAHLSPECRSRVCRLTRADITADFFSPPPPVALLYLLSSRFRFVCPFLMPFVPFVIAFISLVVVPSFLFSSLLFALFVPTLDVLKPLSALRVSHIAVFDIFFFNYICRYQWE